VPFVFKVGALNHSATLPEDRHQPLDDWRPELLGETQCIAANKRKLCAEQRGEEPNRLRGSAQYKGNQAGGEQHQAGCSQRQKAVREKVAMAHGTPSIFD
jgi:hypothetical protein